MFYSMLVQLPEQLLMPSWRSSSLVVCSQFALRCTEGGASPERQFSFLKWCAFWHVTLLLFNARERMSCVGLAISHIHVHVHTSRAQCTM
jgi:hypothetical protein